MIAKNGRVRSVTRYKHTYLAILLFLKFLPLLQSILSVSLNSDTEGGQNNVRNSGTVYSQEDHCARGLNDYSNLEFGEAIIIHGGDIASMGVGGPLILKSGNSTLGSSGQVSLTSSDSGSHGVSGDIKISTGFSYASTSGKLHISTGDSFDGSGGSFMVKVGDGRLSNGGEVTIVAGRTADTGREGGRVAIIAGEGSSPHSQDGGDGGPLILKAGFLRFVTGSHLRVPN